MTEEAALLVAIREHPGEDTPRLVYADWLDEHPTPKRQARAEFIRSQIEANGLPKCGNPTVAPYCSDPECRKCWLRMRGTKLLKKWGMGWLPSLGRRDARIAGAETVGAEIHTGADGSDLTYTYDRGFLRSMKVCWTTGPTVHQNPHRYLEHVVSALASHPCEEFQFSYLNHTPILLLRIKQDLVSGGWYATLDASNKGAASNTHETRRELVNADLFAFVASSLEKVQFTLCEPEIPF